MGRWGITDIELGWLAGILEGEGCFRLHHTGNNKHSPSIQLDMVDEDIVLRVQVLLQRITKKNTNINYRQAIGKRSHYQPSFRLQINGDNAVRVMKAIVKYMGVRRRQKIWQILNGFKAPEEKLDVKAIVTLVTNNFKKVG